MLTTNFDPLIGVGTSRHGGKHYRTVLHSDGALGQTAADGTHIVHLHGYWHGADTLHTPLQRRSPRPQLAKSLARILEGSTLVVVGYGGWDDVMTGTLIETVKDSTNSAEIMWAFHQSDPDRIAKSNEALLEALKPGIGRGRVSLCAGIDCGHLFDAVIERLEPNYPATNPHRRSKLASAQVSERYDTASGTRGVSLQVEIRLPVERNASSDRPLYADSWVGREHELKVLAATQSPVAFVTGIGGQGKSALAAELVRQHALAPDSRFQYWDWRDCREESERLRTQVLRLIERLAHGALDASQIDAADIRSVVRVLFQVLRDKKAVLVFDNVDQYVDLESFELVKDLDVLVAQAQSQIHRSLFLFTCRPDVRVDQSRALTLALEGLEEEEIWN